MKRYVLTISYIFLLFCAACAYAKDSIDVVYTWVDNNDMAWQFARKRAYKKFKNGAVDANSRMRFRNRDELKYSLRSLYKFANFVNHIYVVTCGQTPKWFKPHPKVTIVHHETIFPNKGDLPTFNSHAIECNLHRVPGLSEKYIYMNDDLFFAQVVGPNQFFDESGHMKIFLGHYKTPRGPVEKKENGWKAAWKNSNAFLDAHFVAEKRRGFHTAPFAFNKSTVYKIEKTFPQVFKQVSANHFRSRRCCTMTNGFIPYVAWYWKQATPDTIRHKTIFFHASLKENRAALASIKKEKLTSFGVEDMSAKNSLELDALLHDFLESSFPEKAPWEKD